MIMTPRIRKLALTVHIIVTVGWLGAVIVFLALAATGLTSSDAATVRGAYLVMEPAAWFVLLPLALTSLVTGILQSLGSRWGLLRHYWIVVKLALTTSATLILLAYMETFGAMAEVAADPGADLASLRSPSPALHAALALVVLTITTVVGVYKPRGMTRYGWRRQLEATTVGGRVDTTPKGHAPRWLRGLAYAAVAVLLLAVLLLVGHLTGHGVTPH